MSFSWVESVWLIWHMCHFHHKLDMNIHSKVAHLVDVPLLTEQFAHTS